MKMTLSVRNHLIFKIALALGLFSGLAAPAQNQPARTRVGVYDSRAIAVAYANSTEASDVIKATQAEYKKAKDAKDDKKIKEIETRMKQRQRRMHEQGFSTGSVSEIMAKVKDKLPAVAREKQVSVILSKWELNYQDGGVEAVDVTDEVVGLFHVSDQGKQWIKSLRAQAPIPLENLPEDND